MQAIADFLGAIKKAIKALFAGRKATQGVIASVVGLAATVLSFARPEQSEMILTIAGGVYAVLVAVIAGITIEDSVNKWSQRPQYNSDAAGLLKQYQDAVKALQEALNAPGEGEAKG